MAKTKTTVRKSISHPDLVEEDVQAEPQQLNLPPDTEEHMCCNCDENEVDEEGNWCQVCLFMVLRPACLQPDVCAFEDECVCRKCEECGFKLENHMNYVCDGCYNLSAPYIPEPQRQELDKKRKRVVEVKMEPQTKKRKTADVVDLSQDDD